MDKRVKEGRGNSLGFLTNGPSRTPDTKTFCENSKRRVLRSLPARPGERRQAWAVYLHLINPPETKRRCRGADERGKGLPQDAGKQSRKSHSFASGYTLPAVLASVAGQTRAQRPHRTQRSLLLCRASFVPLWRAPCSPPHHRSSRGGAFVGSSLLGKDTMGPAVSVGNLRRPVSLGNHLTMWPTTGWSLGVVLSCRLEERDQRG